MIGPFKGRYVGIVDGHEITSSDLHRCALCSVRNVSKIEGVLKLNYYHKYSAFILAGQKFAFLLDIEPIYPLEGELSSSHRLLERVCINYPKAFEAVAGDGLYLNGAAFKLLQSHHKRAEWMWVTNLPSVVGLKNIISACHSRWQIENKCLNEIANTWNADHIYRHNQNAISAFILFLFIALNIFNIFFARKIKDKRIRSKTLLIDLIKAEYLLARWARPIPV